MRYGGIFDKKDEKCILLSSELRGAVCLGKERGLRASVAWEGFVPWQMGSSVSSAFSFSLSVCREFAQKG